MTSESLYKSTVIIKFQCEDLNLSVSWDKYKNNSSSESESLSISIIECLRLCVFITGVVTEDIFEWYCNIYVFNSVTVGAVLQPRNANVSVQYLFYNYEKKKTKQKKKTHTHKT